MDLSEIKGFGAKRIEMLKSAGINSPADLISYFPKKYIDTANLTNLKCAQEGSEVVILASTPTIPKVARIRKNLSIVKVCFTYDNQKVYGIWYNQPFMAKNIAPNRYYYISGKIKKNKSTYEMISPSLYPFDSTPQGVFPVYKPIGKISSKLISEAILTALNGIKIQSFIPENISQKYTLTNINDAFRAVHFPRSLFEANEGKKAITIEKLVYKFSAFDLIKRKTAKVKIHRYKSGRELLTRAIENLPYNLTGAQSRALEQILNKMNSPNRLNCLLEGDVGCGKTIVAFLAMYYSALSGYQSALMAPTEVLAKQHYDKAVEFFTPLGIKCVYLSSSVTASNRKKALEQLSSAHPVVAIGTHSLISDDVVFSSLALAVVDEQHRFGVMQRAKLENKTANADCVVMSATPIPRTLALSLYDELDRIIIDEKPSKKAKIYTRFVPKRKEEDMWKYVLNMAQLGEQTFVVAPKISDDETNDIESAEHIFDMRKSVFLDKIALLHGRMKEKEKSDIMARFNAGEIKVIVATTVIEVGIDIPNATTMIIYDAERFGLSQLHQLRGRVGRGAIDSYCFVLCDESVSGASERLAYFVNNDDGFSLAEYDFAVRGAGDYLGFNQHGDGGDFPTDKEVIETVKSIKNELLLDPSSRQSIENGISLNRYEYFKNITLN